MFFIFIVCLFQFGGRNVTSANDYEKGNSRSFYVDSLNLQNYAFAYTITVDQQSYEYYGQRNQDILYFEFDNHTYYFDGERYYRSPA